MELVANIWPVVDGASGIVLRFFVRAYAIQADDNVISQTLRALAPTDFRIARMFRIAQAMTIVSEHGMLEGAVTVGDFQEYREMILRPAFRELEVDFARLQGIAMGKSDKEPLGIALIPRFPEEPYVVVTMLIEGQDGQLAPQLRRATPTSARD